MKRLLALLFVASLTLAVVHNLAVAFFWYFIHPWVDIPMHLLGGFTTALGLATLPFFGIYLFGSRPPMLAYLLVTSFVGVVWEGFEFFAGISIVDSYFFADTVMDLAMDVCGGALGFWVVQSLRGKVLAATLYNT
ncbi:hypothetical protein KC727_03305 [Candidatus Kaiserbacteria bacterium]|nr:hypothetical protein [Candidatus Kaiserbacteria bacterium]